MARILRKTIALILSTVLLLGCLTLPAVAATPNIGVANDQWKQALQLTKTSFESPYMASDCSEEFYNLIGTGHLQGMCVDDDLRYMYVSYTNGIGKIDMQTGEVAGYLTGFDSGLHIGCLAYYDGHIYGSFEAQATHKFYIIQVDESKFSGIMDTREKWAEAVRVILLYEPTVDARDLMGDTWDNGDGIAGRNEEVGHRFSNAGIDGVTFGTYPGEFGKEDADVYMFVSYGTYYFTNGTTKLSNRLDDEHIILQAYNTKDFLKADSSYLLELAYTDNTTPDQNGVSNARSIYYAEDSILHAEKALFAFTGNTQWGCQQIEFDRSTGDIWLSTYGASDGSPLKGNTWHVIDGSKKPQHVELQLGQNVDLSKAYGGLASKSETEKSEITEKAHERATRYGDNVKVSNSTFENWPNKPKEFSDMGYPVGDVPYLKCVCGKNCTKLDGKGDYIGYTAENGYDVEHMICCGKGQNMYMGLVSLGNGYWYWNGGNGALDLYHMDGWSANAVGTATKITSSNQASYVASSGLGTPTVSEEKLALEKMISRVELAYTEQGSWSDLSWNNLQTALSSAKSTAAAESTAAALIQAKTGLFNAQKELRKTEKLDTLLAKLSHYPTHLYIQSSMTDLDELRPVAENAIANGSQTKIDSITGKLESAMSKAVLDLGGRNATAQVLSELPQLDESYLLEKKWQLLELTLDSGASAKVFVDDVLMSTLTSAGTHLVPIANGEKLTLECSGDVSGRVLSYQDERTIKGILIGSQVMEGFEMTHLSYTFKLHNQTATAPQVSVVKFEDCSAEIEITQATGVPGSATVVVTRADGSKVTYTVNFTVSEDQLVDYIEQLAINMTPAWVTTYPNRRGADGENERFIINQGWQFNGNNTDAKLEGVDKDGKTATFDSGFTLHGITSYGMSHNEAELNSDGSRKSDAAIKQEYVDANDLEHYSSAGFNIEGKGYTQFTAKLSVANGQKNHANTSGTVRFYVDGTVKQEQKFHGTTWGIDVNIDLTNAKTFTIQVDPENVDNIGKSNDWANGDIVVFGNPKFSNADIANAEAVYLSDLAAPDASGIHYIKRNTGNKNIWGYNHESDSSTDKSTITFGKWLDMEPFVKAQVPSGKTEETYRQSFIDSDNYKDYSSITWNIEGKGYEQFLCTFGPRGGNTWSATDVTVNFYVDGEKVGQSYNIRRWTGAQDVCVNLTGAKTFTIQMDPKGDGTKIDDFASGDILVFGNARFIWTQVQFDKDPGVDKAELNAAIAEAQKLLADDYTEETWQNFNQALNNALAINRDFSADQENVDSAKQVLLAAKGNLENRFVYLSDLAAPDASGIHYIKQNAGNKNIWGYNHESDSSTDKSTITFTKWLDMEPFVKAQVPSGKTEETYRQSFIDSDNYKDYSSITWNIEGEGYEQFLCTFGPRGGNTGSATDVTVNFYVDGEQVGPSYNIRRWTGARDIYVDLTGAKTFTIQMDPRGEGTKLDDFASGDILVFGNARFAKIGCALTDPDVAAIDNAKSAIEGADYTVAMAEANTAEAVKTCVEGVINKLEVVKLNGLTFTVKPSEGGFSAAVAGTADNNDGTNGSYKFTVEVKKGGQTQTTKELTAAITATSHVKSTDAGVSEIKVANVTANAGAGNAYNVTVPYGTNVTKDSFAITTAAKATHTDPTGADNVWSFTVTAEDGASTQTYTVTVTVGECAHDYVWNVTKLPTTTEKGVKSGICAICGATTTADVDKLPEQAGKPVKAAQNTEEAIQTAAETAADQATQGKEANVELAKANGSLDIQTAAEKVNAASTDNQEISLTVPFADGSVTFNSEAVEEIRKALSAVLSLKNITNSAKDLLPEGETLDKKQVFEVTLKNVNTAEDVLFAGENGLGMATIRIPIPSGYTNPKVYYLANNIKSLIDSRVENGYVCFMTNHFSVYLVEYTTSGGSGSGIGGTTFFGYGFLPFVVENPFTDVSANDWFFDAVNYVYQNKIMDGVGSNKFAPNSNLTRAMVVTVLYRMEGRPACLKNAGYTDVVKGSWYEAAVNWATETGVVNGIGNNKFAPEEPVTHEQLVAMLYRYAKYLGRDAFLGGNLSIYSDASQVSAYAVNPMKWATSNAIYPYNGSWTLAPGATASRAEVAEALMRFMKLNGR